ncbi:MAG: glutathione S-transferase family protein [Sphingobium sp.]
MTEIIFYTNPMSRGRIARWMLEEIGAPYHTEILSYDDMKSPGYLSVNPMGKVPAIAHAGSVVTECAAICAYLADIFPDAGLGPRKGEHADFYRWMFFAAGPVEAAVTDQALGVVIPPERKGMVGYGCMEEVLDALEAHFATHDFVTGGRFTAADVYVGSQIRWGLGFRSIPARPAFVAYADRLGERPALIRATEMDDALIPAKES